MAVLLHTRMRVGDLDRSIEFYTTHLGFLLRGRTDRSPAGNQLAFLQLPGNDHEIELCYSPDYDLHVPEDLMHYAIGVPDLIGKCDELEKAGIEIWPDGWREKFAAGRKMAFITDPDGYEIELLERR
jgi:lactoylglutathione lyase